MTLVQPRHRYTQAKILMGDAETLELKTNALSYIFILLEKAEENTGVVIPGYRRGEIDFATARYKTKLVRQ